MTNRCFPRYFQRERVLGANTNNSEAQAVDHASCQTNQGVTSTGLTFKETLNSILAAKLKSILHVHMPFGVKDNKQSGDCIITILVMVICITFIAST